MTFEFIGIKFEISYLFLCALTVFIAIDRTGIFLPLMLSVVLHESAHILSLFLFKCKINKVKLKIGTVGIDYSDCMNFKQKIVSIVSGPILNMLLGVTFYFLNLKEYSAINYLLFFYNIMPIKGLDGGELLNLILSSYLKLDKVKAIQRTVSVFFIVILFAVFLILLQNKIVNYSILLFIIYLSLTLI